MMARSGSVGQAVTGSRTNETTLEHSEVGTFVSNIPQDAGLVAELERYDLRESPDSGAWQLPAEMTLAEREVRVRLIRDALGSRFLPFRETTQGIQNDAPPLLDSAAVEAPVYTGLVNDDAEGEAFEHDDNPWDRIEEEDLIRTVSHSVTHTEVFGNGWGPEVIAFLERQGFEYSQTHRVWVLPENLSPSDRDAKISQLVQFLNEEGLEYRSMSDGSETSLHPALLAEAEPQPEYRIVMAMHLLPGAVLVTDSGTRAAVLSSNQHGAGGISLRIINADVPGQVRTLQVSASRNFRVEQMPLDLAEIGKISAGSVDANAIGSHIWWDAKSQAASYVLDGVEPVMDGKIKMMVRDPNGKAFTISMDANTVLSTRETEPAERGIKGTDSMPVEMLTDPLTDYGPSMS